MVYNPLRRSAQDMRSTCFTAIVTAQLSYSEVGASDDGQNQLSVIVCAINHQSIIIQHVSSSLLVYVGIQSPRVTFISLVQVAFRRYCVHMIYVERLIQYYQPYASTLVQTQPIKIRLHSSTISAIVILSDLCTYVSCLWEYVLQSVSMQMDGSFWEIYFGISYVSPLDGLSRGNMQQKHFNQSEVDVLRNLHADIV